MIDYSVFTLDNGLRVVHHFDDSTSHVAVNVLYDVGARDESPSLTGMAHLFEHLMFGGSVNVPDYDYAIEMAGGSNNAWTSNDFTNFYDVVPAANLETAFWAESDRMYSLAFDERSLEVQRGVVMEEFKQVCLNKPYGDMGHLLRGLLYKVHPYGWPTIGKELSHIERVTMADVRRFFFSHYSPSNAVLAVAGPVALGEVRRLAEKWFGPIERRATAPRLYAPEPEITEARSLTVEADVPQTKITLAVPMGGRLDADFPASDLLTDVLASGNSSRFYRNLVLGTDLFTSADASVAGSEEPGFLMLNGSLRSNDGRSIDLARRALWNEARRIADEGVTADELERTLNRFECNAEFTAVSYLAKAQALAKSVMRGIDHNSVLPAYRSVTEADIKRVASELLKPERCCTLIYKSR